MRTPICRSRSDSVEEAQCLLVPARRGGRGAGGRRGSDAEQQVDRRLVPWRADCATWWARSAAGAPRSASEAAARACAARRRPAGTVRTRPAAPADGGRRRASGPTCHARDPARGARRARPATSSGSPATAAARSGSKGSPATAAPFSSARSVGMSDSSSSMSEAATARRHDAPDRRAPAGAPQRSDAHARELLEVERIATALAVDRSGCARVEVAEQERRLLLAEALEDDPPECRDRERRRKVPGRLRGTEGEGDQDARPRGAPEQCRKQGERRLVGPVQVIEDENERAFVREELEESAHGAMGAVALVGDRPGGGSRPRSQPGQDPRQLADRLGVPGFAQPVFLRGGVRVERVDPGAEGLLALELRRAAGEHQVAALVRTIVQLCEHARLADARLALDGDAHLLAGLHVRERLLDLPERGLAADDRWSARRVAGRADAHRVIRYSSPGTP